MSSYISKELRSLVTERAFKTCEYCLFHQDDAFFSFHVDHIISIKHGGKTIENNLAYACAICNREKGSDLGSLLDNKSTLIRFYNPRKDKWLEHFQLDGVFIKPLTDIGKVTSKIFKFNEEHRLIEREALIETTSYPSSDALQLIKIK